MSGNDTEWRSWIGPRKMPRHDGRHSVEVGDKVRIQSLKFGKDRENTLLLLHGGPGSSEDFNGQIPESAESSRGIAVDTRGLGRSTDDEQSYSYSLFAHDVIGRFGIRKADIAGWSDGADTGLELAMRYPDRISKHVALGGNVNPAGVRPSAFNDKLIHTMTAEDESRHRKIPLRPIGGRHSAGR